MYFQLQCSLLHVGFLYLWRAGTTFWFRCAGFSLQWFLLLWSRGSRVQAQQLWHIPCIVRQILNHCTPGKSQDYFFNVTAIILMTQSCHTIRNEFTKCRGTLIPGKSGKLYQSTRVSERGQILDCVLRENKFSNTPGDMSSIYHQLCYSPID